MSAPPTPWTAPGGSADTLGGFPGRPSAATPVHWRLLRRPLGRLCRPPERLWAAFQGRHGRPPKVRVHPMVAAPARPPPPPAKAERGDLENSPGLTVQIDRCMDAWMHCCSQIWPEIGPNWPALCQVRPTLARPSPGGHRRWPSSATVGLEWASKLARSRPNAPKHDAMPTRSIQPAAQ